MSTRTTIDLTELKQEIIDSVLKTIRAELGLSEQTHVLRASHTDMSTKSLTHDDDRDFKKEAARLAKSFANIAVEDELDMRPRAQISKPKTRAELESGLKGNAIWQHLENASNTHSYPRDQIDEQWEMMAHAKYSSGSY